MYLSKSQLDHILKQPFFSNQVTEDMTHYVAYRGKLNCAVYTVRFNMNVKFDEHYMKDYLIGNVMKNFRLGSRLLASIQYDFLLVDPNSNPPSYYIWKANSNLSTFNHDNENLLTLTYDNLFRFMQNAAVVDIPSLAINFRASNVIIERVLAIVFSFADA